MSLFDDPFYLINQRLKTLEAKIAAVYGGRKVGLGDGVLEYGTAGFEITSFGVNNWLDDAGDKTPEVTLEMGSRCLIFAGFRPTLIGNAGTVNFRSIQMTIGIAIDGTAPDALPLPVTRASYSISTTNSAYIDIPSTFFTFREGLEPGEHTFTMQAYAPDTNPTGTINPLLTDTSLAIFPLGFE